MKKIIFNVYDTLAERIDETVEAWGFQSRADFFRYAAIDFMLKTEGAIPSDKSLDDYGKKIASVKAA